MFFARHVSLMLPLAVGLALPHQAASASPAPSPANVAEFGVVTFDISGAQAFSASIAEKKTIKNIKKSTAKGAMRFREGASGIYRVRTLANGKTTDDQGQFVTVVSIEIPRPEGALRFTATGERRWVVPATVPELWPAHHDPYEPIFRGPNAKEDRKKWRRERFRRYEQREARQRQARQNYRRRAIGEAFRDSLQDAREEAESQLQKSLHKVAASPASKP